MSEPFPKYNYHIFNERLYNLLRVAFKDGYM